MVAQFGCPARRESRIVSGPERRRAGLFFVLCALCFVPGRLAAQDRSRMAVYVPVPEGGTAEQREYFQTNFRMELIGANYPSVETAAESAYTLQLSIVDNPGFDPFAGDEDENALKPDELDIRLTRTAGDEEIVSFSFLFDTVESMNAWNLYLLYQALANAYVDDGGASASAVQLDDRWRNKYLYLSLALGMDIGYFMKPQTFASRQGVVMPGARLGVELHFLPVMSLELIPLEARMLHNGRDPQFEPAAGAALKGVFKPLHDLMVEPYAGALYSLPYFAPGQEARLDAMAGIQLGFRGGLHGAVIADFSVSSNLLGKAYLYTGADSDLLRFSLKVGYKTGFGDRKPASAP
jgi:hypothetical protein